MIENLRPNQNGKEKETKCSKMKEGLQKYMADKAVGCH
jgi:hypothetical protein